MASKSSSLVSSSAAADSAFLYSRGQSSRMMRGFLMARFMRGCVESFSIITPRITMQSLSWPPGIFSTFAKRLMSISRCPAPSSMVTMCTASSARSQIRSP